MAMARAAMTITAAMAQVRFLVAAVIAPRSSVARLSRSSGLTLIWLMSPSFPFCYAPDKWSFLLLRYVLDKPPCVQGSCHHTDTTPILHDVTPAYEAWSRGRCN